MGRADLERLSKDELIELVLRLQRPEKTSRPSSKPPPRTARNAASRPAPAVPSRGTKAIAAPLPRTLAPHPCPGSRSGHRAPARMLPRLRPCAAARPAGRDGQHARAHRAAARAAGRGAAPPEQHRRLAVTCPACQARVAAPRPAGAVSTPFGARLHATAVYLKCFQALSYERLQRALSDLFGLTISQGGLMAMLRRAQTRFAPGREAALSALRRAAVVACDETGVRIEGSNSYHWVFRCDDAVVHHAAPTRAGS